MRLTEKEESPKVPCYVEVQEEHWKTKHKQQAIDKLGQLEDIEERLGIDLITAVKGAYNGIYYIHPSKDTDMEIMKGYISLSSVDKMEHSFFVEGTLCCLSFLNYGKKIRGGWAFTKEELETDLHKKCIKKCTEKEETNE